MHSYLGTSIHSFSILKDIWQFCLALFFLFLHGFWLRKLKGWTRHRDRQIFVGEYMGLVKNFSWWVWSFLWEDENYGLTGLLMSYPWSMISYNHIEHEYHIITMENNIKEIKWTLISSKSRVYLFWYLTWVTNFILSQRKLMSSLC